MSSKKSKEQKKASAAELIALRNAIGHTQEAAADFLYVSTRTYQNWEYGVSRAPLAFYEYYELKAITRGLLEIEWMENKKKK